MCLRGIYPWPCFSDDVGYNGAAALTLTCGNLLHLEADTEKLSCLQHQTEENMLVNAKKVYVTWNPKNVSITCSTIIKTTITDSHIQLYLCIPGDSYILICAFEYLPCTWSVYECTKALYGNKHVGRCSGELWGLIQAWTRQSQTHSRRLY